MADRADVLVIVDHRGEPQRTAQFEKLQGLFIGQVNRLDHLVGVQIKHSRSLRGDCPSGVREVGQGAVDSRPVAAGGDDDLHASGLQSPQG